jgi:hypothetical protein
VRDIILYFKERRVPVWKGRDIGKDIERWEKSDEFLEWWETQVIWKSEKKLDWGPIIRNIQYTLKEFENYWWMGSLKILDTSEMTTIAI